MTVTVKHSKTNAISDWTQAQLDEQIALGNFPAGTTLANIVLPSDWNNDHTLTGVGTMAEQNANSVAITGGTINNTSIGATTASTGKFTSVTTPSVTATTDNLTLSAISTGAVKFNTLGGLQAQVSNTASSVNYVQLTGGATNVPVAITSQGSDADIGLRLSSFGAAALRLFTNNLSTEQARVSHTASAVNYVQVTGSATTVQPVISAQGSDSAIGLVLTSKGGNNVLFRSNNNANTQFTVNGANASVNNLQVAGSLTGSSPILSSIGTDTNISMAFQPKGTGAIDLAAGSSGVNISNGGTVTAVTMTNNGTTAYTSHPTPTITAPTTAGGVQALGTANMYYNSALATTTIVSGGTGYTLNDVLTLSGGTFSAAATFTVSGVSGGVVTAITATAGGTYSAIPTGTLSVTGGTGTGFTFTINGWGVRSVTVGTAGSGYIEQPTITFSGGGGSGAAAYATVGSGTIVRTLGSTVSFYTPGGEGFRVVDVGATTAGYWGAYGSTASPQLKATGSSSGQIVTISAVPLQFITGNSAEQMRIAHTASAVNYVQVTGAATTATPTISAQGSDGTINLAVTAKGSGSILFFSSNGGARQLEILHTASTVNYLQITGSISGSAPSLKVAGTDTNIDLALTPKGTGVVRFGTYTANMALTVQGYIEIKDSGGTLRKLAVIA